MYKATLWVDKGKKKRLPPPMAPHGADASLRACVGSAADERPGCSKWLSERIKHEVSMISIAADSQWE